MKSRLAGCLLVTTFFSGVLAGQQSQVSALATSASSPLPTGAAPAQQSPEKKAPAAPPKHKIGPFEITINWRTRAEGWNWFQGKTGNSDYPLWDSLLRIGIGQTRERLDWYAELEQASILGLPNDAVVAAPQGQLGL